MIFKLVGLGPSNYIKDSFNIFDAAIVVISLVDQTLAMIPEMDSGRLSGFRALRLLRIFKLTVHVRAIRELLRKIGQSLKDISNFSLLLLLLMYIFALLGMDLFAERAIFDSEGNLVIEEEKIQALYASGDTFSYPPDNFNGISRALTTIFIVIIGEDWNWTMYQWVRAYGHSSTSAYFISIIFFVLLVILGNIIMLSLFTAILLRNFEESSNKEDDSDKKVVKDPTSFRASLENLLDSFKSGFGKKLKSTQKKPNKVLNSKGELRGPDEQIP